MQFSTIYAFDTSAYHGCRKVTAAVVAVGKMVGILGGLIARSACGIGQAVVVDHHKYNHIMTEILVGRLYYNHIAVLVNAGGDAKFVQITADNILVYHIFYC